MATPKTAVAQILAIQAQLKKDKLALEATAKKEIKALKKDAAAELAKQRNDAKAALKRISKDMSVLTGRKPRKAAAKARKPRLTDEGKADLSKTIHATIKAAKKDGIGIGGIKKAVNAAEGAIKKVIKSSPNIEKDGDKATTLYFYKP